MGTGGTGFPHGGVIISGSTATISTATVGNEGTGVDTLMSYELPAGALGGDGKALRILAWGTTANNANTKQIILLFGATAIVSSPAENYTNEKWWFEAFVVRTSATAQEAFGWTMTGGNNVRATGSTTPAETMSGAITIKLTGEATASNDIVQRGMIVEFVN